MFRSPFGDNIAALTGSLRRSDEERLALEERRFEIELEQRKIDREERRIELEEANQMELE